MKRLSQCDFGYCPKDANVVLITASDKRPMCSRHAAFTIEMRVESRKRKPPLPKVTLQLCNAGLEEPKKD